MYTATSGIALPTTITGSLPRPSWYTENLGIKAFLDAMVISRFREQYVDTVSCYLREQEVAGRVIAMVWGGRFSTGAGGAGWPTGATHHMAGRGGHHPAPRAVTTGAP